MSILASTLLCYDNDPYFDDVNLLMHFDGVNDGNTFIDSSSSPKTFTLGGSPITSTTTFKFGTASGYFNGNSWLTLNTKPVYSGIYTIEGWAYSSNSIFQVSYNGNIVSIIGHGGFGGFLGSTIGVNSNSYIQTTAPINTWYHWAVVQYGSGMKVFINGVESGNNSIPGGLTFTLDAIGRYNSPYGSYNFTGYLDELRITQGVARYTTNFTPPTKPFPS